MEYIFYRLWQLLIGKSEEDMPPFGSMMLIWMFEVSNIETIDLLVRHFFDFDFGYTPKTKNEVVYSSLVPILSVLIFNIFYLFRRRAKIEQKYKDESKLKKKIGNFLVFTYGILSIVLSFIIGNAYPIG